MIKKFFVLFLLLLSTGCASSGKRVTNFTDRSVVYGWLGVDDIDGNHMFKGRIKGLNQENKVNYYGLAIEEFKGGFVFYTYVVRVGTAKLLSVDMQSCLGFACTNIIYTYDFSGAGTVPTVKIDKPGVYHMGNYELSEVKTGLFKPSKFNVSPSKNGPSKKEIMEFILEGDPDLDPVVSERLKKSIKGLGPKGSDQKDLTRLK